ncbi:voltage-gated potassium channel Kch [Allocatelliglobosispora scoriae]|uniref:Voltage-gated potassium channel Kch n=1 Tax=Allocatelliglobosispora scoriae TaxID=643052 RepID=A0A841C2Y7_9ACTN|nr:NAD-binding protein [Allocatelliglobosispora scoriae]MBB5873402.1 voltage-gated potassium channel Kch [Allocatelliglobosispora scoriae]
MSSLSARLRYWFDNTMARGTPALVGLLGFATLAVLIVVSFYLLAVGDRTDGYGNPRTPAQMLWESLTAVLGLYYAPTSGHWQILLGWLLLGLGGLFITSAFIGVISSGISGKLDELRRGRSHVEETGHTVLLGWSDQIFMLLGELAAAGNGRRGVAVILASRDKAEMEDAIRARIPRGALRVVCRTGSPLDPADLDLVNPGRARAILLVNDHEDDDADIRVIKTLLAARDTGEIPVVACVQHSANAGAAGLAADGRAIVLDASEITARLLVQTARQPGLFDIYLELLDFAGQEIHLRAEPALTGHTFGEALLAYPRVGVIGLVPGGGRPRLNPPMSTRLGADDRLIVIDADAAPKPYAPVSAVRPATCAPVPEPGPDHTLVLGWSPRAARMLAELDAYVVPGSTALVVSREPVALLALPRLAVETLRGDPTDRAVLDEVELAPFSRVVVLCEDHGEPALADARTLVTLLHLRDIIARTGHTCTVVSEMRDDRDRVLAEVAGADDFVVSQRLISLLMTQLAQTPELRGVFEDLFDPAGAELYLHPVTRYAVSGRATTFAELVAAAASIGQTAVGYRRAGAGPVLSPPKDLELAFEAGDMLIVLADGVIRSAPAAPRQLSVLQAEQVG